MAERSGLIQRQDKCFGGADEQSIETGVRVLEVIRKSSL